MRIITAMGGNILIQLPQRTVQGDLTVVGQNLVHIPDLNSRLGQMRRQQIGTRIAKDIQRHQRLGRQQLRKLPLARKRQSPLQIGTLQITQPRVFRKILGHRQSNRDCPPHPVHDRRLQG